MSVGLAPRPANEEQRAKAVVKTGLIESPNPDLFQVYCDLAKDITGFTDATFSLYDGEMQCAIAMTGKRIQIQGRSEIKFTYRAQYMLICFIRY